MQFKNLAVLLFSVGAIATVDKRQSDQELQDAVDDAMDHLPTQLQDMPEPDPSILKVFQTAIPQSLLSNPNNIEEAASSIANGDNPSWYNDLPGDAKSYFSELQDWATGKAGEITGVPTSSPTSGSGSGSGSDSSSDSDSSSESGSSGSDETAAPTQSSTGGAPGPTGAVAASFAGAVGILGLAVAL